MAWIKNWFSNMEPFDAPLVYDKISYYTVENFYQAMKLPKQGLKRLEISKMNPYAAKKAIRDRVNYPWHDWNEEKSLKVMEYALRYKFTKETTWGKRLIETGIEEIVEWNNWNDTFWGKNVTTLQGENHLGKILMGIREDIS